MKLETLATSASAEVIQLPAQPVEITGITCDSRQVRCGDLFAALPGVKADGSAFARQAAARGAAAILAERSEPLTGLPQLCCRNARLGLALAARAFYEQADLKLKLGAVTGTNGKTTTAYLVRHLLRQSGLRCGMLGTVEYDLGAGAVAAPLTTPESVDLHRYLRAMADSGCQAAFMETSSHALHQNRAAGLNFSVAVFTNLTRDHLDYHGTMKAYREAKAILFRQLAPDAVAVLNLDTATGRGFRAVTPARVLGYALKRPADLRAKVRKMDIHGTVFQLTTPWGARRVSWRLAGAHNVENALGALAAAVTSGADFEHAVAGLETFEGVPGRLEAVDRGPGAPALPFRVFVDYAHTDDALSRVIAALRALKPARLLVVFGCGGDRDRTKRPRMARAVQDGADYGYITSDNPRSEDPRAIITEIQAGVTQPDKFTLEVDRAKAIDLAIQAARDGDVVLIAGKGHENYQIIGTERRHFSDVEQARAALARRFEERV